MQGKRILVVEDQVDISNLLMLHLNDLGAQAKAVGNGLTALTLLSESTWDLVILDLQLPGIDGLEVCRRLRAAGNAIPILMLTARTSELDRVLGLEVGADDYVGKPFSTIEVMARVRALLRRVSLCTQQSNADVAAPHHPPIAHGPLQIDEARREVKVNERVIELTPREFDLLLFFARTPGQVFRRMQLLDGVWGFGHEGYEHTVNSHINRLRAKLSEFAADCDFILTVWGVGYKFNETLKVARVA